LLELKEQKKLAGHRLKQAISRLFPYSEIFSRIRSGIHYFDFAAQGVNKGTNALEVQAYVQQVVWIHGFFLYQTSAITIVIGDGDPLDSNDAPLYQVGYALF